VVQEDHSPVVGLVEVAHSPPFLIDRCMIRLKSSPFLHNGRRDVATSCESFYSVSFSIDRNQARSVFVPADGHFGANVAVVRSASTIYGARRLLSGNAESGIRVAAVEAAYHAPGTAMNSRFIGPTAWQDYLNALEQASPVIEAIAVTDYYVTDTFLFTRMFALVLKGTGRGG
jgi:hypothetical protein